MRKKVPLTPDQVRLRELEKILKKNHERLLRFLLALGEIGSKELHKLSHRKLSEYLHYKYKTPYYIARQIEDVAIDLYERINGVSIEKTRAYASMMHNIGE